LGVDGYWYQQISDDNGNIPAFLPAGFRGDGVSWGLRRCGRFRWVAPPST
jgi:hypothetical protein